MKNLFLLWMCLALGVGARAQSRRPLPLRPAFVTWKGSPSTATLDTVPHPGTIQIPCRVAYLGSYVLFVSGRGEVSVSSAVRKDSKPVFAPHNSFDLADVPRCSSVYGDKIVFISITDGYVQPKRYTVIELSLARAAYIRHYRSRAPICAAYSADGTRIVVETQGQQQMMRSAY